jgi:formylmethanofuran--tetrahydromethanopterin N-formyltransferase
MFAARWCGGTSIARCGKVQLAAYGIGSHVQINGVTIEDTFAEAFGMKATRIRVTAVDERWARQAGETMTGFATSVIGCGVEAGIEQTLDPADTPDGRPGVSILLFAMSDQDLAKHLERRVGQCILTCPTTAVFAGMEEGEPLPLGKNLRFFGDGWQISKRIGAKRYWRVPVMDGEFLAEETTGRSKAVGGGNFLVLADSQGAALAACEAAVLAMRRIPNVVMPFPGGIVRSGSKVGSKYKALMASTNQAYCPTLRGLVDSRLDGRVRAVLEIVVNGLTPEDVAAAMRAGILAACGPGPAHGVLRISAGNYGGKLGQFHFRLRELMT